MIHSTTNSIEGREVSQYHGVVTGEAILGANIFKDFFAGIRDIVGGRSAAYEQELGRARKIAFEEMSQQAADLGANAVIGIDIDYETVGPRGGMLMVPSARPGRRSVRNNFRRSGYRHRQRESMHMKKLFLLLASLGLAWSPARGDGELQLQPVIDNVYAIVGDLGNRSAANLGNNATFGFVVTEKGVVLIDSGATEQGARRIDALIDRVTADPVIVVINTGGQDHRWLGNDYFRRQGARIVASRNAVADQRKRLRDQFIQLDNLLGSERLAGTEAAYADETFDDRLDLTFGDTRLEIRHPGPAHTPGDSFVWLPRQQVMFSGDIVYVERMAAIGAQSNSRGWLQAFDAMAAYRPAYLVPGHGKVTTLEHAHKDTREYLAFLRDAVGGFIDDGGDLSDIGSIDQSAWTYLRNHELLAGRNAHRVFTEMEWE